MKKISKSTFWFNTVVLISVSVVVIRMWQIQGVF
jgi:hypothetical protein